MSQDGIWIIDREGRTSYLNDRMAEILGVLREEILGQHSFEFVYPEDLQDARRLFDAKKQGDSTLFHFKLRRRDGSPIWVDVQGTPMYNAAKEFKGIVGTFTVSATQD